MRQNPQPTERELTYIEREREWDRQGEREIESGTERERVWNRQREGGTDNESGTDKESGADKEVN